MVHIPRSFLRRKEDRPLDYSLKDGPTLSGTLAGTPKRAAVAKPYVFLPGSRTLVQNAFLPPRTQLPSDPVSREDDQNPPGAWQETPPRHIGISSPIRFSPEAPDWTEQYRRKKVNQWTRWTEVVIPQLIKPYMNYMAEKSGVRSPDSCSCGGAQARIQVTAVYQDRELPFWNWSVRAKLMYGADLEQIDVPTCPCRPAPVALMRLGLFGCAPMRPSIALDINMLEFVSTMFLNLAPNVTGWCESLEIHLRRRGYKLKQPVSRSCACQYIY